MQLMGGVKKCVKPVSCIRPWIDFLLRHEHGEAQGDSRAKATRLSWNVVWEQTSLHAAGGDLQHC